VVQDLLGHRTIVVTMDTYSHVLPELQRQAADTIGNRIAAALSGKAGELVKLGPRTSSTRAS